MGPLDALWHLLNFFAPALGVALCAALAAKLLWRHELAGAPVMRLWAYGTGAGAVALIGGLIVFGHDGKMATYGALVVFTALAQWCTGFMRR